MPVNIELWAGSVWGIGEMTFSKRMPSAAKASIWGVVFDS